MAKRNRSRQHQWRPRANMSACTLRHHEWSGGSPIRSFHAAGASLSPPLRTTNACSMLPPLDNRGLLPHRPTPYECDVTEVKARFVDALGAPAWREDLFAGWDLLRRSIASLVPTARWWIWGWFVSGHEDPQFGDRETIQAVVLLPVADMPVDAERMALFSAAIQAAQSLNRVDVSPVYLFPPGHPGEIDTLDVLEFKWRPRASVGVPLAGAGDLEPAGFLEVVS